MFFAFTKLIMESKLQGQTLILWLQLWHLVSHVRPKGTIAVEHYSLFQVTYLPPKSLQYIQEKS
jgi:hypothetical protein